jgi:hypothetical protein
MSAMDALVKGLDDLTSICKHVLTTVEERLDEGNFELIQNSA